MMLYLWVLLYFVVAQERGIPESIISDPTNPNKYKMFYAVFSRINFSCCFYDNLH